MRARVIRAHDVHAETLHVRQVYNTGWEEGAGGGGADIHTPSVESTEIHAHDIHASGSSKPIPSTCTICTPTSSPAGRSGPALAGEEAQ